MLCEYLNCGNETAFAIRTKTRKEERPFIRLCLHHTLHLLSSTIHDSEIIEVQLVREKWHIQNSDEE